MNDLIIDEFQYTVNELLIRNKSILDAITKLQDSSARVNRSIIKSVTQCGCVSIDAKRQPFPEDADFDGIRESLESHLKGDLCENCRDIIENEIGRNLFYIASICNTLGLNLYDIMIKELDRVKMLGKYNLR